MSQVSSLATTLHAMRPHLPRPLISAAAFRRACAAITHLPAAAVRTMYFECRMHDRSAQVDLIVAIQPRDAACLAAHAPDPAGPAWWDRLLTFCQQWTAPGSQLGAFIDHVWLAYDIDSEGACQTGATPAPGVYFSFEKAPPLHHDQAAGWHSRSAAAIESLTGRCVTQPVAEGLRTCFDRLPPSADVAYVGLMTHRATPVVRICLTKIRADALLPYVAATAAARPEAVNAVMRLTAGCYRADGSRRVPMLHLDLDTRGRFLPRVGMERPFERPCQQRGAIDPAARHLLDQLTHAQLCTRAKGEALLSWPGRSVTILPHELEWSVVDRRVNHLKLVVDATGRLEAKGYLFVSYSHQARRADESTGTD